MGCRAIVITRGNGSGGRRGSPTVRMGEAGSEVISPDDPRRTQNNVGRPTNPTITMAELFGRVKNC